MKFSHSIVIAALLGSLTFTEVNAVAIKQSEAQRLMESIDVDMENMQSKKKHHKAKKHHKKATHAKVQTADDAEAEEPAEAKAAKKEAAKKAEIPAATGSKAEKEGAAATPPTPATEASVEAASVNAKIAADKDVAMKVKAADKAEAELKSAELLPETQTEQVIATIICC